MKNVFPPKENTIEYPNFRIFLPYTNLQPATLISLIGYNYTPVKLEGEFDYSNYFKERWKVREKFITIEHDMVLYPGAIEAIWDCPEILCGYDLSLPIHRNRVITNEVIPGCLKITPEMIDRCPHLWDEPIAWSRVDKRLYECGVKMHQHFPGIINANPALLGFVNYEEDK